MKYYPILKNEGYTMNMESKELKKREEKEVVVSVLLWTCSTCSLAEAQVEDRETQTNPNLCYIN
jgi:hypothetical protein